MLEGCPIAVSATPKPAEQGAEEGMSTPVAANAKTSVASTPERPLSSSYDGEL